MADRWSRLVCLSCSSELGDQWQREHPEAAARHKRNHHLLTKFGITLVEAESILTAQGGVCAVCRKEIIGRPHIDHDHATGKVRGVLCVGCNLALGAFCDDTERMVRAIAYIEASR